METMKVPKDWQLSKLEDMLDYIQPTQYIVESTDYSDDFKTPVLTAGKTFLLGYTNEQNGVFKSLPVIIFDDFTTANKFVNFPFKVKSSAMKILKAKHKDVNIKYVHYYMQTLRVSIDTHKRYWISVFSKLPIPHPSKELQQKIVSKVEELFSELDKGIEELKKALQQLKVYRQAVLQSAFEGKLTNEYIGTGTLPNGWMVSPLKNICNIIGGVTKGKNFKGRQTISLPYLRVANVQDGYLNLKEIKYIDVLPSDKDKYALQYGDILYTEGGDKDKLGRGTIWKEEVKDCIHQNHVFRARPLSTEYNSRYIAYFSQTKSAKNYFYKYAKQTTNLASINLTVLSKLPVPICSLHSQQIIVQEIESRLSVCDNIQEAISISLQQAEALKQSILKRAFEGELYNKY
jgi:type I restriction enzyme, S subunit